jgi:hypothetical protein
MIASIDARRLFGAGGKITRIFASPTVIGSDHPVWAFLGLGQAGATLFDLGGLQDELESLLGVHVDLLIPADLPQSFGPRCWGRLSRYE